MTGVASFTMTGDREMKQMLQSLDGGTRRSFLENAAVLGGLVIVNAAKVKLATTPSITGRASITETGDLERSIHVGGHTTQTPGFVGDDIGGNVARDDYAEVQVGTNKEYARRVELGFMDTDKLGREYSQPAQPYLRPAMDENKQAAMDEMAEAVRAQFRKAARS